MSVAARGRTCPLFTGACQCAATCFNRPCGKVPTGRSLAQGRALKNPSPRVTCSGPAKICRVEHRHFPPPLLQNTGTCLCYQTQSRRGPFIYPFGILCGNRPSLPRHSVSLTAPPLDCETRVVVRRRICFVTYVQNFDLLIYKYSQAPISSKPHPLLKCPLHSKIHIRQLSTHLNPNPITSLP